MIPPINCPYKGLTAPPCWSCTHHIADTDQCALACIVSHTAINAGEGEKLHCGLEMYVQDFNISFLSDDESEQEANIILQPAMRYGMEDEWKEGFDLHYQRKEEPEETDV